MSSSTRKITPPFLVVETATGCRRFHDSSIEFKPGILPWGLACSRRMEIRGPAMNTAAKTEESSAISHTEEMTQILNALTALRRGDAKARLPYQGGGAFGKVAEVFNDLVEQNATMAGEFGRLSQVVGKEGKLKKRATLHNARGFWAQSIDSVNSLIDDLVHPTSEVGRVIGAVAQGDLSKSMALEMEGRPLEGEFLRTAKTINKMVEQLGSFSAEVTRGAREGPNGVRELDGQQPPGRGAQRRGRQDRRGEGRPVEENRSGGQGRVPYGEIHDQHDGGPAPLVRVGSDPGGARSRVRRDSRRPGASGRRLRHVERPDRFGELAGRQPHLPGAQHRRRDQTGTGPRPLPEY